MNIYYLQMFRCIIIFLFFKDNLRIVWALYIFFQWISTYSIYLKLE